MCEQNCPDIIGNKYFIFGTMNHRDWKEGQQISPYTSKKLMECSHPFIDVWHFDVEPAKWVYFPKKQKDKL